MSVRYPVHTPVRTPMYGLPLSQSDQRIRSVFQSVYNNNSDNAEKCSFTIVRPQGDSFFHSDEQPELNLENDYPNKTGHTLKTNSSISYL